MLCFVFTKSRNCGSLYVSLLQSANSISGILMLNLYQLLQGLPYYGELGSSGNTHNSIVAVVCVILPMSLSTSSCNRITHMNMISVLLS